MFTSDNQTSPFWLERLKANVSSRKVVFHEAIHTNHQLQTRIPLCSEIQRCVPNALLRSALFGIHKNNTKYFCERVEISTIAGCNIYFTGQKLDQIDLDIWLSIIHLSRESGLETPLQFKTSVFLKKLNKTDTGKNRQILHTRLTNLVATAIELRHDSYSYIGGLIKEVSKNSITKEYSVLLNKKLIHLFGSDQYTKIDWRIRQQLSGKPLSQWLHGFYSTHVKSYPYKISTIKNLCGSVSETVRFKQTLTDALISVHKAHQDFGLAFDFKIDNELLTVIKSLSKSQKKNLLKHRSHG